MFASRAVVVAPMLAVLLLAGCGIGDPTSTESSTPTPSHSRTSSPTPTPTPTATASADPADPSTWVISSGGVGPLLLGGDRNREVASVAAAVSPVPSECGNDAVTFLGPAGTTGANAPFLIATGRDATQNAVVAVAVSSTAPRTVSGIGVGSTAAAVRAAYPTASESSRSGVVDELVVRGDPGWVTFQLTGADYSGTVELVSVVTGQEPPSEYCG